MEKIPLDIIINNIIPYTYNIQPKLLLEDIQNYYEVKLKLMDEKYDTNIIKHELLAFGHMNQQKINNILDRNFKFNIGYKYPENKMNLSKKNVDKDLFSKKNIKFNIVFGLLSKKERNYFSEYIFTELYQWII